MAKGGSVSLHEDEAFQTKFFAELPESLTCHFRFCFFQGTSLFFIKIWGSLCLLFWDKFLWLEISGRCKTLLIEDSDETPGNLQTQ